MTKKSQELSQIQTNRRGNLKKKIIRQGLINEQGWINEQGGFFVIFLSVQCWKKKKMFNEHAHLLSRWEHSNKVFWNRYWSRIVILHIFLKMGLNWKYPLRLSHLSHCNVPTPTYSEFYYSDQMTSSMLNAQISLLLHFWCKYGVRFGKVATWNTQF